MMDLIINLSYLSVKGEGETLKHIFYYQTSLGEIGISANQEGITGIFLMRGRPLDTEDCRKEETPVIRQAAQEITEYLEKKRTRFTIPLSLQGTEFQKRVWNALQEIPYGETRSYKQIAEAIQQPNAYRAVGMANNKNPVLIIIPCHRVIGAQGKLVGYAAGVDVKQYLLKLEQNG